MKTNVIHLLVVATVVAIFVMQEYRHRAVRHAGSAKASPTGLSPSDVQRPPASTADDHRTAIKPRRTDDNRHAEKVETLQKSIANQLLADGNNPVQRAMLKDAIARHIAIDYASFIEEMQFDDEQYRYFTQLLTEHESEKIEVARRLISASDDDRKMIVIEVKALEQAHSKEVATFLNDAQDHERFVRYNERLPERSQMGAIGHLMSEQGQPLNHASTERLIEAMYEQRAALANPNDGETDAFSALVKGIAVDQFDQQLAQGRQRLLAETAQFLTPEQQQIFIQYHDQFAEDQRAMLEITQHVIGEGSGSGQ